MVDYPMGPQQVPADLSTPSPSFKRHAWLAMTGLATFIVLYLSLGGWFAYTALRLLGELGRPGVAPMGWLVGLCSAVLAIFMFKALFFVRHGGAPEHVEITSAQEPKLFDFLYRLADETGAPRPHRVFLSPHVNACVFYDLSPLNLVFPSKKNLEIGVGLINVLTMSEFKAVLAHEFGHFAQRTMAVGSWVYIAQQIAAQIVSKRDALDKLLRFVSRTDFRIAWVAWALMLVIWSLRAVLESAFKLVVIAQRALSREMEFQADLVATKSAGSDAIVHALYRLQAADESWDRAQRFAFRHAHTGHRVGDVFAIQLRFMRKVADILNDRSYGKVPPLPTQQREQHRVFTADIAHPPRMWATHPQNHEREINVKRRYIAAPLDERSAWSVFADADNTKQMITSQLLRQIEKADKVYSFDEALAEVDKQFDFECFRNIYQGTYLGRSFVRHVNSPEELYNVNIDDVQKAFAALYPHDMQKKFEQVRNLEREQALLEAVRDGHYQAPDGVIRFRDKTLEKRQLPQAIATVKAELNDALASVYAHDQLCRSAHWVAAKQMKNGWDEYLKGLLAVLHYVEHSDANLHDAYGALNNVVAVVTADGKVSKNELARVISSANDLHSTLRVLYTNAESVTLNESLLKALGVDKWSAALGEFNLPEATQNNINDWMNVIHNWVGGTSAALQALRQQALEELLRTEVQIAKAHRTGVMLDQAPTASVVNTRYNTLLPGQERPRQKRLDWWDHFQIADGVVAATLRGLVAATIVLSALLLTLVN